VWAGSANSITNVAMQCAKCNIKLLELR